MTQTHLTIREISQRWHDEARQNQPLSMELIGDLLDESPVPFRRRNLFVSANALSRV